MHWAIEYIGKEWVSGANGPDAFDCWGLVRYIQKIQFQRELPIINVDADDIRAVVKAFTTHDELTKWTLQDSALNGDCVLMSQGHEPTHVGIWIDVDGGGILHAVKGAGVVFSNAASLRLMGYNLLGIYRCLPQ